MEERFIICVPSNARITINIQVEVAAVLRAYFGHIALLTTSQDVNLYTKSSRMEIPNSRSFSLQRGVRGYPPRNRFLQGLGRGAGHSIILCTPQAGITYINKHSSKRQSSPAYDIGRWLSLQDFEDVVPITVVVHSSKVTYDGNDESKTKRILNVSNPDNSPIVAPSHHGNTNGTHMGTTVTWPLP